MTDIIPEDLTANGLPFRTPRAFANDDVQYALNPASATVSVTVAVGDLIAVRSDGTAVLADPDSNIAANAVCVRVTTSTSIIYSREASIDLALTGVSSASVQPLWLGASGKPVVTPPSGLNQQVGLVANYDSANDVYRCLFNIVPAVGVF